MKIAPELLLKLLGPSFEYVGNIPPRVAEFGLNKIKEIEIKNLESKLYIYETMDGKINVDVILKDDSIWVTQKKYGRII